MDSNDQSQNPPSDRPQPEGERRGRPRRRGGRGRSRGQRQGQERSREQGQEQPQVQAQDEGQARAEGQSRAEGQAQPQGQPREKREGRRQRPQGQRPQEQRQQDQRPQDQRQQGQRSQGQRSQAQRQQSPRASKVSLIVPATPDAQKWADRIQEHLQRHARSVTRLDVEGNAGLTERLKEARAHGAHRIVAVGNHQFVRWAAQAMVGSLMPLAPALLPGSEPIFGYQPLPATGWEPRVEALLSHRFSKVDMAMGTVNPFVHQLLAGFPASNGTTKTSTWQALFNNSALKLKIQVDRTAVEGDFWCLAMANADLPHGSIRWLPGSNWEDQRLDLLLVRPRSLWQKWKFLQALKRGEHGAQPGVLRYRGHRITVHAEQPWRYSADGSQTQEAASPLVVEARPEMLRLVVPEGS